MRMIRACGEVLRRSDTELTNLEHACDIFLILKIGK
ncbi:Uncharacterised protein [Yersinia enterocolitica]|nr:Uncharacterised protein [Yersinia enterocolitica]CNF47545.1 Uncharacterised protein [Yersinia enterocolitica]CNG48882.1 Uncharacterised protein [Yersinia enterocolitica]CNJ56008.1 Uncharacterised protein [Yersinia enterocolitica]